MRRRKHLAPPPTKFFRGREATRLLSMVCMLVIVGMMMTRARDPAVWRWLASDASAQTPRETRADELALATTDTAGNTAPVEKALTPPQAKATLTEPKEVIVPGPTDLDPEEREIALEHFQAITDKVPLQAEDMPTYWRFMRWSRAASFRDLQKRSRHDLMFTHFWQEPEIHRGELIELKLHVRRVLSWDAPANSADVKKVYEAWGTTDESKSHLYVVVFSELPANLPQGDGLLEEAVFVGYFLKNMGYSAYNVDRAAPLLVGRLEWRVNPARKAMQELRGNQESSPWQLGIIGLAAVLVVGAGWYSWKSRSRAGAPSQAEAAKVEDWLDQVDAPDAPLDADEPSATTTATTRRRSPLRDQTADQQPDPFDFGE